MLRRTLLLGCALLACDSKPASADATPAAPAAPPPALQPAAPPAAAPAATPVPGEPSVLWWCACYHRSGAAGPEPLTACRAAQSECAALERAVETGKRGIVRGSLTHPCQELRAAHPGDLHGGREVWRPSQKPGAWLSPGACRLPGPGRAVDLAAAPPADEGADDFAVLHSERIGELRIGLPAADLVRLHGEPTRRDRIEASEVDGDFYQTWEYPALGLSVGMSADTREGAQSVAFVTVRAPSTLATAKSIRIGSPRADVVAAYDAVRDREMEEGDSIIAGSIYGGVMFDFADGEVSEIFLGAAAE